MPRVKIIHAYANMARELIDSAVMRAEYVHVVLLIRRRRTVAKYFKAVEKRLLADENLLSCEG